MGSGPLLSQNVVAALDWFVVAMAGILFVISIVGAGYAFRYSAKSRKHRPTASEFNHLWQARAFTQVVGALYALSLLLRLQVLWGPSSVFRGGGYHPTAFCRVYTATCYGLLEPGLLLLSLFACLYSIQGRDSSSSPNLSIVAISAAFSLPTAAAQLVAALFTRMFDLDFERHVYRIMFSTAEDFEPAGAVSGLVSGTVPGSSSSGGSSESGTALSTPIGRLRMLMSAVGSDSARRYERYCLAAADGGSASHTALPGDCSFCTFPLLSVFVSAAFLALYFVAMGVVTQRLAAAVINKRLVRRVRVLQVLVVTLSLVSLAARGATAAFVPFDLGFEALRVAHAVLGVALALALQYILVLRPVYDSAVADRTIRRMGNQGITAMDPALSLQAAVAAAMPPGVTSAAGGVGMTREMLLMPLYTQSVGGASTSGGGGVPTADGCAAAVPMMSMLQHDGSVGVSISGLNRTVGGGDGMYAAPAGAAAAAGKIAVS